MGIIEKQIKRTIFIISEIDRIYPYNPCPFGLPIRFKRESTDFDSNNLQFHDEWVWRKLVAGILCCNEQASKVRWFCSNVLFVELPNPAAFVKDKYTVERLIKPYFKYYKEIIPRVIKIAEYLVRNDNKLPNTKTELMKFEGVGEHIAELIVGNCFNDRSVFPVDRHVIRICERLELIMDAIKKSGMNLPALSSKMVNFGTDICSHKPVCQNCFFRKTCRFNDSEDMVVEKKIQLDFPNLYMSNTKDVI
jgi:endonuclease III